MRLFPLIAAAPRKVGTPSCCNGDIRTESLQTLLQRPADAACPENKAWEPVQYDRHLLHCDLNSAFSGRDGVAQRKGFLRSVICGAETCGCNGFAFTFAEASAEYQTAGTDERQQR